MKHRSFRKTGRRPVEWVTATSPASGSPGYNGAATVALANATLVAFTLLNSGTGGGTGLPAIERVTVMRIKGQVIVTDINSAGAQYSLVSMGIAVVDVLGGVADAWDPTVLTDSEKSWLWLNHATVNGNGVGTTLSNTNETSLPHGGGVDIKVKRILRPDQSLVLFIKSNQSAAHGNVAWVNLRTLVARAI